MGETVTKRVRDARGEVDEDEVDVKAVVTRARQAGEDPIRALLRARGYLDDEDREPPAPRGEDEPLMDYLERVSAYIMRGRVFTDNSADLLREAREERTAQLERAIRGEWPEER